MQYPATFTPEKSGSYAVTFRDIPEANTHGFDEENAMFEATEALVSAMASYFEKKRPVPLASALMPGEKLVELHLQVWAKVLLLNEMLQQNVRPAELARRMNTSAQVVNRLVDIKHATKIETIHEAMKSLGVSLSLFSSTLLTKWKFVRSEDKIDQFLARNTAATDAVGALYSWESKNSTRKAYIFDDNVTVLEAILYTSGTDLKAWEDLADLCSKQRIICSSSDCRF
ncbi:type II toxin-antitoxin system HicB family antitoxin [Undibacterium sp. Di26W]|uniref:type II toxin-antitoxin system HicB family antitoxin n=1 Tax=Undibacterium sp. Di26W TaxID=3413035 RepID=UPI003BF2A5FB